MIRSVQERLEARLVPEPNTGCWLFDGCLDKGGYGRIGTGTVAAGNKRTDLAHRVAYEVFRGNAPNGRHVCHKCDTPTCCNPDHLFLGDPAINAADKVSKGRQAKGKTSGAHKMPERRPRGERHGHAKLTEGDVRSILASYSGRRGVTSTILSKRFNVAHSVIASILRGEAWSHVAPDVPRLTSDKRFALTEKQVEEMRSAYQGPRMRPRQKDLALRYGISISHVSAILSGKVR